MSEIPSKFNNTWIVPLEIAGYGTGLQVGMTTLGFNCEMLDLSGNPYGYTYSKPQSFLARALVWWHSLGKGRGKIWRYVLLFTSIPMRFLFVVVYFRRDTLIISLFGKSMLGGLDLKFARKMGATVIVVLLGSDSRPPYLNGVWMNTGAKPDFARVRRETKKVKRAVLRAERNADIVICSPSTGHFLTREFVNWFHVGIPTVTVKKSPASLSGNPIIKIIHAPTRPRCKGSQEIANALSELKSKGYEFSYFPLHNIPNTEVRNMIDDSDLVVDELYSDTLMGGLGAEAASAGVPCLTFGFADQELVSWTQGISVPLDGYDDPITLMEKLEWAISNPDRRKNLALDQQEFFESNWSPSEVASKILRIASGDTPKNWMYSPGEVGYIWGFGIPKEILTRHLIEYLNAYGFEGLCLSENSSALRAIQELME